MAKSARSNAALAKLQRDAEAAAAIPAPASYSGVVPSLCMKADQGPARSECGIGGLVSFAGKLWAITYVSHRKHTGTGTGLYEIDENLRMVKRPESYPGTYANRFIHAESEQLFIGPWAIDNQRRVRTITPLLDIRLAGTARHLTDPKNKVLFLGMEGELFEVDVKTLAVKQIADLVKVLDTPGEGRVHFKDIYTAFGRVVVADNTYDEADFEGKTADGRLAEWDGKTWRILERKPFVSINGLGNFAKTGTIFASGWDRASAILKVYTDRNKTWSTYRLPKATQTHDHMWQTEWPRIRSIEHERMMLDLHGMFYELSPHCYINKLWGVRPISTHLWVIPDYASYRGLLVMGSDNASFESGENTTCIEPQSGLWVGKTDDLWNFGKPAGWGGPLWNDRIQANTPSDPYLMTGFDNKCIHLSADAAITFTIEIDFLGTGDFKPYLKLAVAKDGYAHHVFPPGFSAHWLRVTTNKTCTATAQLHYT